MLGMGFTATNQDWPSEVTHGRIWDIGAIWANIHVAPNVYDWDRLDEVVAKMEANGMRHITYVIAGTPAWAAQDPDAPHHAPWLPKGSNSLPGDPNNSWKPFVWNLSERYKGRIHAYEVWNECQLPDFMYPWNRYNRRKLARMTDDAVRIIKGNDPDCLVGACSVLPRPTSGGMRRGEKFFKELRKRKDWGGVDFFAAHLYPEGTTRQGAQWVDYFNEVKATLRKLNAPHCKVWVTETALGLLSGGICKERVDQYLGVIAKRAGSNYIMWYAWDREDLGGAWIGPGTSMWDGIKRHWK
jgi:hypothetical protein